jgi:uncharacterized protein (TIGR04222 family)
MIDILINIPAPIYLLLFAIIILTCYFLGWFIINIDGSLKYPLPEINTLNPYQIAALRGGRKAVIRTVIVSLWNRKLLRLESLNANIDTSSNYGDKVEFQSVPSQYLKPISYEQAIHDYFSTKATPNEMFQNTGFQNKIDHLLDPTYNELEKLHLFRSKSYKNRAYFIIISISIILIFIAGVKLYYLEVGNMQFYLFIELCLALIFLNHLIPKSRTTKLGRKYLTSIENHFSRLNSQTERGITNVNIDSTYLVAVFGIRVINNTLIYKALEHSLKPDGFIDWDNADLYVVQSGSDSNLDW